MSEEKERLEWHFAKTKEPPKDGTTILAIHPTDDRIYLIYWNVLREEWRISPLHPNWRAFEKEDDFLWSKIYLPTSQDIRTKEKEAV